MSKASDLLGILEDSTAEEAKLRWRELASIHHPDKGGDAETFNLLRQAYETFILELKEPKICAVCQGSGKISHSCGFANVLTYCVYCNGRGVK